MLLQLISFYFELCFTFTCFGSFSIFRVGFMDYGGVDQYLKWWNGGSIVGAVVQSFVGFWVFDGGWVQVWVQKTKGYDPMQVRPKTDISSKFDLIIIIYYI